METLEKVLLVLTIIGAVNWGLIGILDFNLVTTIFLGENIFSNLLLFSALFVLMSLVIFIIPSCNEKLQCNGFLLKLYSIFPFPSI